ncbi:MAG: hypothetical protein QM741_12080 [Rudaea sp.]|uniref:dioxygenase family protein n=1 Tax=Rudaea sp. TaxID=2136325 RepID=UPI0039E5B69C
MRDSSSPASLRQRRRLLKAAGNALLAAPLLSLNGCRTTDGAKNAMAAKTPRWASGGTAKIGSTDRFPDPFGKLGNACALTCMATIGPCHALSPERSDISDGWDGLPLRLALRVVDADCRPLPDAIVEIWHTNHTGGYSGRIAPMCNNDQADLDKRFFRGYQRTNAHGRVDFDTCYPGWYRGRAVHIHLRVMTGDYRSDDRAPTSVTTQLFFSDAMNRDVFTRHPLYRIHGVPETSLDRDGVIGAEKDKSPYLCDTVRMDDGVLFASKTLIVRASPNDVVCEAKGMMPPGGPHGPGGPPPGFPPPPAAGYPPPPGEGPPSNP